MLYASGIEKEFFVKAHHFMQSFIMMDFNLLPPLLAADNS